MTGGLIGASYFGAEYRFGTIEQVLLWEPRRSRVLLAKYLTTFIGSALVAIIGSLAIAFSLWPTALAKGTTQGVDARLDEYLNCRKDRYRGRPAKYYFWNGSIFTRHTAGAVMSLLGYQIIGGIISGIWIKWLAPWDPLFNTGALSESDTTKWAKESSFGQNYWVEVSINSYLVAGFIAFAIASAFAILGFIVFNAATSLKVVIWQKTKRPISSFIMQEGHKSRWLDAPFSRRSDTGLFSQLFPRRTNKPDCSRSHVRNRNRYQNQQLKNGPMKLFEK